MIISFDLFISYLLFSHISREEYPPTYMAQCRPVFFTTFYKPTTNLFVPLKGTYLSFQADL